MVVVVVYVGEDFRVGSAARRQLGDGLGGRGGGRGVKVCGGGGVGSVLFALGAY